LKRTFGEYVSAKGMQNMANEIMLKASRTNRKSLTRDETMNNSPKKRTRQETVMQHSKCDRNLKVDTAPRCTQIYTEGRDDMVREYVKTENAPAPKGPYSQGIRVGNFVFVSGQGPFDPKTGKPTDSDVESQTRQTLQNVKAIIERADLSMHDIVRMTVFLKNAADFPKMNEVYKSFFAENPPTRTTVEANFVTPGILVTIDAIACRA